jgi:CRP-like cAMP-binding protein
MRYDMNERVIKNFIPYGLTKRNSGGVSKRVEHPLVGGGVYTPVQYGRRSASRELNLFKEAAQQALLQGEWKEALEYFRSHCAEHPDDLRSRLKMGELLERLGNKKEAVRVYRDVAEFYCKDGFILQAISLNKMILRIDPSSKDASDRLAQLFIENIRKTKPLQPIPHIPLFSELNEQELRSLLSKIQAKTFFKNSVICRERDSGDSLMVIARGEVGVYKKDLKGEEVWIRNLGEGDFFGEFGFFTDQKRHSTIKASTESEILEISRSELNELMKVHPRFQEVIQNLFKERVLDLLLAFSPLFSSLNIKERGEVIKRLRLHSIPEETFLFRIGDPPTSLYMIKSGEVKISIRNRQGQEALLENQKCGNFFGEISLLLNQPRMVDAKTTKPSELFELTKEDFEKLLHQFPGLQSKVEEISSKRLFLIKKIFSQKIEWAKEAVV